MISDGRVLLFEPAKTPEEAKMATFDQLVFVFAEKNLFVLFLDFVFSNNTSNVFCLICIYSFFIFFLLNVHPDTFKGPV